MIVKDQRHMTGGQPLVNQEEVRAAWTAWGQREGFRRLGRLERPSSPVDTGLEIVARIDAGRWVADCLICRGGIATWPEHERACCLQCGSVFRVKHPAEEEQREALRALAARPVENRVWFPETETAEDLRHENIRHGFQPVSDLPEASASPDAFGIGDSQRAVENIQRQFGGDTPEAAAAIQALRDKGLLP